MSFLFAFLIIIHIGYGEITNITKFTTFYTDIPLEFSFFGVNYNDGNVYIMGGWTGILMENKNVYSFNNNNWVIDHTLPVFIYQQTRYSSNIISDTIYFMDDGILGNSQYIWSYNVNTKELNQNFSVSVLPEYGEVSCVANNDKYIFVINAIDSYNSNPWKFIQWTYVYDLITTDWHNISSINIGRIDGTCILNEYTNAIYLFGGQTSRESRSDVIEKLDINYNNIADLETNGNWELLDSRLHEPTYELYSTNIGYYIYLTGGRNESRDWLKSITRFDVRDNTLSDPTELMSFNHPRSFHVSWFYNHKLYIYGGWFVGSSQIRRNSTEVSNEIWFIIAHFGKNYTSITIEFEDINYADITSTNNCANIFDAISLSLFGNSSQCFWINSTLNIALDNTTNYNENTTLQLTMLSTAFTYYDTRLDHSHLKSIELTTNITIIVQEPLKEVSPTPIPTELPELPTIQPLIIIILCALGLVMIILAYLFRYLKCCKQRNQEANGYVEWLS